MDCCLYIYTHHKCHKLSRMNASDSTMGLQNQLFDVSSESFVILTAVMLAKTLAYLRSVLFGAIAVFHRPTRPYLDNSPYDAVGSGLTGLILLCEQLNLNQAYSYRNRSIDGPESDCVMCLDRMGEGDYVRKLACSHVFHKDCFDGWLDHLKFDCPLCRAPLVSDERVDCTRRRVAGDLLAWFPTQ